MIYFLCPNCDEIVYYPMDDCVCDGNTWRCTKCGKEFKVEIKPTADPDTKDRLIP